MKKQAMRDAFFDKLYELAKNDKDIVVVSADLGAPALDKFRLDFPEQFINVGISEQNAILVATGLALAGKKPIAYAITQFITLRCYEQIRIYPCGMNLPVTIVGVGAGACYSESGPTHHCIEDLSIMRALPNIKILNSSDSFLADKFAELAVDGNGPKFIRLDREIFDNLHGEKINIDDGFSELKSLTKINILATGNMVKTALDVANTLSKQSINVGVVDIFQLPVKEESLIRLLKESKGVVTLEEHSLAGGFGSYILEILNDAEVNIKVKRIGFDTSNGYEHCYNYGGREAIRGEFGMDFVNIIEKVRKLATAF
ncbi:transketolase family protein [Anaerosinus massiliensis]|uniref:transketolase family protein n=1 Tax=Massilibacillus massiliensis TaxID=1806837 RepID=UPI000DA6007C|nr:transketolase C-terminal domain-containing protein [Massilibacillus massiliensis]